jgi:hypothetical protein
LLLQEFIQQPQALGGNVFGVSRFAAPLHQEQIDSEKFSFLEASMNISVKKVVSSVALTAVIVAVCGLFNAPARADQIVIISTSPTLEMAGHPLSFSFEFDATTALVVGTPVINFDGSTFTYNPAVSFTGTPPTFRFVDGSHFIDIGNIGLFQQPGVEGFPAAGMYSGLAVAIDDTFSAFNGTVDVTAAPEPGTLALLSAELLLCSSLSILAAFRSSRT